MRIGVFDSGIGGEAVAAALQKAYPHAHITTVNDKTHVPYGDKSASEVLSLTDIALQPLINDDNDVIVLACNTATAVAIETLRSKYPSQHFIGIEPMIKPASLKTRTNTIAVCATPATLASERYRELVKKYGRHLDIIEPDCSQWAYLIENNQLNRATVEVTINEVCTKGADVIVLGCTHYHWIKELIVEIANGRAEVLEPSEAIGRRVAHLLDIQYS
ncbi:aspartate/glutamate racemase family protein [Candidatus Saccharibacteria bacterium]|nr:aspartate/glutamate racemase family protein [Candidatus Saccharibacteria bacterium]